MPPARTRKRGRAAAQETVVKPAENVSEKVKQPPELSVQELRKYIRRYSLPINEPMSFHGYIGSGNVGKDSISSRTHSRSTYLDALAAVTDHLKRSTVKEGDTIAEFLYTIQHRKESFKLNFGQTHKEGDQRLEVPVQEIEPEDIYMRQSQGHLARMAEDMQKEQDKVYVKPVPLEPVQSQSQLLAAPFQPSQTLKVLQSPHLSDHDYHTALDNENETPGPTGPILASPAEQPRESNAVPPVVQPISANTQSSK